MIRSHRLSKCLFVLVLLCVGLPTLSAQTVRHAVAYEDSYHLYQRDSHISIVHIDIEWPRVIDNSRCQALQRALTAFFFADSTSYASDCASPLDAAYDHYARLLGTERKDLPETEGLHKTYVDIKLRVLATQPDRILSLVGEREVRDADSIQGQSERRYFNYDLIHDRMLSTTDIFNPRRLKGYENRAEFESLLYASAMVDEEETEEIRLDLMPQQLAFLGDNVMFDLGGTPTLHNLAIVPTKSLHPFFSKTFRQWLAETVATYSSDQITEEMMYGPSDSLCVVVDSMAHYPNGDKTGVLSYLSQTLNFSSYLISPTDLRVLVSFVVKADGSLSQFVVMSPSQPLIDREVVKALRALPRWCPAIKDHQAVATRFFLPINLRLQ